MRTVIAIAMSLSVVSLAAAAAADSLIMRDGTRVAGTVLGIAKQTITLRDTDGLSHFYSVDEVATLEFGSATQRDGATRANGRGTNVLSSGTELVVRTTEDINSATATARQTFAAVFEREIIDDWNDVMVPEGSGATLVIRRVTSGGATGGPEMTLDIQAITVRGRRYLVSTEDLKEDSKTGIGQNRRTVETIGGGAALGTLIGAIAGGGKGAAIGILAGAAGGAGVEVLTRGKDVRVPAETVLTFRLDRTVGLQP